VKARVLESGADFVGIASSDRFDGAPPHADPARIMPDYRAVICFGIAMSRGCLQAWFSKRSRRPQDDFDYRATESLDDVSFGLTRFLEQEGSSSCYIKQNESYNFYNGFKPDFSHKHAAMVAGLGAIGKSSLFVHPKFGAAVHLGSAITEAPLDPDPMIDADEENLCDDCGYCVQICPVQAIRSKEQETFIMSGKTYTHHRHDMLRCFVGCDGLDGHEYRIGKKTVGTWSYNSRRVSYPVEALKLILMRSVRGPGLGWASTVRPLPMGRWTSLDGEPPSSEPLPPIVSAARSSASRRGIQPRNPEQNQPRGISGTHTRDGVGTAPPRCSRIAVSGRFPAFSL
jgi:ferredoxin